MIKYPERPKFFAHKAFRVMHKASVAAEIGRDAFCLIAVVLHTEDAARYRGPVRFWNSQLMETLGFRKWETFDKARKKAVDSGWLHYHGDGKRTAGAYFVVIPEQYGHITDDPIEPELYTENGYDRGYDEGYKRGYDRGMIEGIKRGQSGVQTGDDWGEPYIPIPDPVPKHSSRDFVGPEIQIPKSLTEADVAAISDALHRYDLRMRDIPASKPFRGNDVTIQSFWNTAARHGAAAFCDAVEQAIQGGWQNLRLNGNGYSKQRKAGELTVEQEAEWVRISAACRMSGEAADHARKELGLETAKIMRTIGGSEAVKRCEPGDFRDNELKKRFFAARDEERKKQMVGAES